MLQARASGLPRPGGDAADAARTIALQMLEERGRGAVLVGVARVDAVLESLLQAVLRPAPGATDTFFQPDRPLGSFRPCITLAARLGVIDPLVEQTLQTLRRVRNAFAHSTTTATLHDPGQVDRLAQAYAVARANALWAPLERILQDQSAGESAPLDHALRDYILGSPCAPLPAGGGSVPAAGVQPASGAGDPREAAGLAASALLE